MGYLSQQLITSQLRKFIKDLKEEKARRGSLSRSIHSQWIASEREFTLALSVPPGECASQPFRRPPKIHCVVTNYPNHHLLHYEVPETPRNTLTVIRSDYELLLTPFVKLRPALCPFCATNYLRHL